MQSYTGLFYIPIFSTTLVLKPLSVKGSPVRRTIGRLNALLPLRTHPTCCLIVRFFLTCFFLCAFFLRSVSCELSSLSHFSPLCSLYLRSMLDRRFRCAVIACNGSLRTFLTILLAFSYLRLTHRCLTVTCIFRAASIADVRCVAKKPTRTTDGNALAHWVRHEDRMRAGIRHEPNRARYPRDRCPINDPQ